MIVVDKLLEVEMAGKLEALQREMEELRKVRETWVGKLDDAMKLPDAQKKLLFDNVVPLIKARVLERIEKGATQDWPDAWKVVFSKIVEQLFSVPEKEFYDTLARF